MDIFGRLPKELINNISFFLPLKDIQNLLLSNRHFSECIELNWRDYFIYHSHVNMINNWVIDKTFMIKHGRYLMNKSMKIIEQYLNKYPLLVKADLMNVYSIPKCDEFGQYEGDYHNIDCVDFVITGECMDFIGIKLNIIAAIFNSDDIVTIGEHIIDGNEYGEPKIYQFDLLYERFKVILLKNIISNIYIFINGKITEI